MNRSNETFRRWSISLNRAALRVARSKGGHALALRGLNHFQPVLVGAGEKKHVLAVEPLKTGQRIGRNRLIGVADVRRAVRIGDRCRNIERISARRARRRHFSLLARRLRLRTLFDGCGLYNPGADLPGAGLLWLRGLGFFSNFGLLRRLSSLGFFCGLFWSRFLRGFVCRLTAFLQAFGFCGTLFRNGLFGSSGARRFARFLRLLFGSFLFSGRHHEFLYGSNMIVGIGNRRSDYRVASASSPNTEKTSGFRSRL